jgi:hypothetical protein
MGMRLAIERISRLNMKSISAPKKFRELSLKIGEDPEVWVTKLKDLCVRLDNMSSSILDNQFMIRVLNNLTPDYDLHHALIERRFVIRRNL